ncbi:Gfo/Idh/MocA family protein [Leptolyngbya sp. PCC 6406]|uniref:Gfo/Idh/MocA family protein n=1 Tax=Leptolyngbya sp. PCC 6406 TaxID=1173264 RepID=UPI0002ACDFFA|nr:Gfo/Idh/MocA family oxidoreductase [Leptolyngbya sp. PCC 6406]
MVQLPIRTAIVGTGYAARLRAEALQAEARSQLVAIAGHRPESTATFAQTYGATPWSDWREMVAAPDIDLIVVCHVNRDHAAVVRAALQAQKAVVVEYPLALSVTEAAELIALAQTSGQFLHVEHIELLGGLHQAMQTHLSAIGTPLYGRYSTVMPQTPAPQKWTYAPALFGFPLMGAVSRVHRFTNLFGPVETVFCRLQYDYGRSGPPANYFTTCRCVAQLQFQQGMVAELLYAKGEQTWVASRDMVIEGSQGAMVFTGDRGELLLEGESRPIEVAGRRGLFAKDTAAVLDALVEGKPLYVSPEDSLYALRVAAAAQESVRTGEPVGVNVLT